MANYCPKCGIKKRREEANFCHQCGHAFGRHTILVSADQTQLSSFDPARQFSEVLAQQLGWLRQDSLLERLQQLLDNIGLRTLMEQVTHQQREQAVIGNQSFNAEKIELLIDRVRNARRLAEAEIDLEVKQRSLEIDDTMAERQHQRSLAQLHEEQQHAKEMEVLRTNLLILTTLLTDLNKLKMIQLESRAYTKADLQRLEQFPNVILEVFQNLAQLDAHFNAYTEQLRAKLETGELKDAPSFDERDEVTEAIIDYLIRKVNEYGQQHNRD